MGETENCLFCNEIAVYYAQGPLEQSFQVKCPNCGTYHISDWIKDGDFTNDYSKDKHLISGLIREKNDLCQNIDIITTKNILSLIDDPLIPKTNEQKLDKILLSFFRKTKAFGQEISVEIMEIYAIGYAIDALELTKMVQTLIREGYLTPQLSLKLKGMKIAEKIASLQSKNENLIKKETTFVNTRDLRDNHIRDEEKKRDKSNKLKEQRYQGDLYGTDEAVDYDVFISHASEDKEEIADELAQVLIGKGIKTWYDKFSLSWGDSLSRKISEGISNSKFGIVILSHNFFSKEWPQQELEALFSKELLGYKRILPIWHHISVEEVSKYSPLIAGKLALKTSEYTVDEICNELEKILTNTE